VLGIDHALGTIEPGKQADIAVFTKHPLDITARVKMLFIGGCEVFAREAREREGRGLESI
jgi:imidazolonepropionase-like amidohydrolase